MAETDAALPSSLEGFFMDARMLGKVAPQQVTHANASKKPGPFADDLAHPGLTLDAAARRGLMDAAALYSATILEGIIASRPPGSTVTAEDIATAFAGCL